MLSYQHAYHAGNLADVHKHSVLALVLAAMVSKPKPLTYIETHAGRGLYDLGSTEAAKTGEAAAGIARAEALFAPGHPYLAALAKLRATQGPAAYPGSPLIAAHFLRYEDRAHLAELHPQEHSALLRAMRGSRFGVHPEDGAALALRLTPPVPGRGLVLIDPSYEVKTEFQAIATLVKKLHKRWEVGVKMIWYPILDDARHGEMLAELGGLGLRHEVAFAPPREGHRIRGSGLVIVNPPYGIEVGLEAVSEVFGRL